MTPWTVACQAFLSLGFLRQKYWNGLPFPPGDLPDLGIEPISPALAGSYLPLSHQGSPKYNDTLPKELNIYLNLGEQSYLDLADTTVIKCARFATSQVRFKSFLAYAGLVAKSCQASLSFTISLSLLKLMFIESVMPSNHLILCHLLLLLPSIFPNIRFFSS